MNTVNLKKFLSLVERRFQMGTMQPIFGIGKGGIGKTEGIHELTEKLKIGFCEVRLLLYSEVDLVGIPVIDPKTGETNWARNSLFPIAERDGEKGILVLDEITSAPKSVRTAVYQLLDSKRSIGNYKLPPGWLVVGLGNGEDDGGDFQGLEGNLINRGSCFRVVPEVQIWKEWASRNNINPMVMAFLSFDTSMLHNYNPDMGPEPFASPRSWKGVSDELNYNEKIGQPFDPDDFDLYTIVGGNVGEHAANKFVAFYKYKRALIDPQDILSGKIKETRIDKHEVVHMTLQAVIRVFSEHLKSALNRGQTEGKIVTEAANLCNWVLSLERMALDYAILGVNDINQSCPGFSEIVMSDEFDVECPRFVKFCIDQKIVTDVKR